MEVLEQDYVKRLSGVRLERRGSDVVVDLLFASSGIENEVVASADLLEVLPGLTVPVATTAHLIALKVLAGRSQDLTGGSRASHRGILLIDHWRQGRMDSEDVSAFGLTTIGHRNHGLTCEYATGRIMEINFIVTNHGRCPMPYIPSGDSQLSRPGAYAGSGQNENVSGRGHACYMSRSQSTGVDIYPASGPWFLTEAPPVNAGSQAHLR